MAAPGPQDVTRLLRAWSNGEQDALEQLIPLVYNELWSFYIFHVN